jgi:hypothetical protein
MVLEKSGMNYDTARILSFWQTLAASGKKSTRQRYNREHTMSGGRVYWGSKSFVNSSRVPDKALKILLFHSLCHHSDTGQIKIYGFTSPVTAVRAEMFKHSFSHKSSLKKGRPQASKCN